MSSGEQAYYFGEFVRLVSTLLPIGLILIAMIFFRRAQRTSETFVLQSLAGLWLVVATTNRLILSSVTGISMFGKDKIWSSPQEEAKHIDFYFAVSSVLHFAELTAFMFFAAALLVFFRQRLQASAAPNGPPLRELHLTSKLLDKNPS